MPINTGAALKELQPTQRKANYKAMQKYNFFQKMIDANNAFAESQKSPQLEQIGAYYKGAGEMGKNVGETLLKGAGKMGKNVGETLWVLEATIYDGIKNSAASCENGR